MAFLRAEPAERKAVMDDLMQVGEDSLAAEMVQRVAGRVREVIRAVNAARSGHLIDDSEGPVLAALRELDRELYEAAIQARVDATEAAASFPPSGPVGAANGGTGAAESFGNDATGADSVDASPILERGPKLGGSGGRVGGSGGSNGESWGSGKLLPVGGGRRVVRAGGGRSVVSGEHHAVGRDGADDRGR